MALRRAIWAALVSLLLPGVGHFFGGAWRRGTAIAFAALAAQAGLAYVQAQAEVTPHVLAIAVALAGGLVVGVTAAAADAWRIAFRHVEIRRPLWWQSGWTALGAMTAANLGVAMLPLGDVSWSAYSVPSASMLPTLQVGDRFFAQEGWYAANPVRRGDVVVFTLPDADTAFVKRVVGIGGDRVRMAGGRLMLNGEQVPMTLDSSNPQREVLALPDGARYAVQRASSQSRANDTPDFQVPPGHIFVMGDNLDDSYDSRLDPRMRYIPVDALAGRAAILYWPLTGGRYGRPIR